MKKFMLVTRHRAILPVIILLFSGGVKLSAGLLATATFTDTMPTTWYVGIRHYAEKHRHDNHRDILVQSDSRSGIYEFRSIQCSIAD
jgi:hypothetical protein